MRTARVLGAAGRLALLSLAVASPAFAGMPEVNWVKGPTTVDLGDQAQIQIGPYYTFANAADSKKLMEAMGNTVSNDEVGLVMPRAKDQDWFMLFEYQDVGYVKDTDKDEIDKDAILEGIRKGTEEANEVRKEKGIPALHVTGWFEEPHYDPVSHNLVWALKAKNETGEEVVNYNMRVLGRHGYMSVTLVDEPAKIAVSRPEVVKVLAGFGYKPGRTYAEFVPGDKVAEYGLVALVAGGAGAAAVKLGVLQFLVKLLAKGGKAIVVLVVAALAAVKRMFASLFGRGES
jgi:uncharacterized membrane-anchored protein